MASVMFELRLYPLESFFHVECPSCRTPLLLHQPDISVPDRMLGICCDCQDWYLMDNLAGTMAMLPDLGKLSLS
jgi:hypothetical protein